MNTMHLYVDMLLDSPLIDVVDARDGHAVAVDWLLDRGATLEMARWSVTAARLERDARWRDAYLCKWRFYGLNIKTHHGYEITTMIVDDQQVVHVGAAV